EPPLRLPLHRFPGCGRALREEEDLPLALECQVVQPLHDSLLDRRKARPEVFDRSNRPPYLASASLYGSRPSVAAVFLPWSLVVRRVGVDIVVAKELAFDVPPDAGEVGERAIHVDSNTHRLALLLRERVRPGAFDGDRRRLFAIPGDGGRIELMVRGDGQPDSGQLPGDQNVCAETVDLFADVRRPVPPPPPTSSGGSSHRARRNQRIHLDGTIARPVRDGHDVGFIQLVYGSRRVDRIHAHRYVPSVVRQPRQADTRVISDAFDTQSRWGNRRIDTSFEIVGHAENAFHVSAARWCGRDVTLPPDTVVIHARLEHVADGSADSAIDGVLK